MENSYVLNDSFVDFQGNTHKFTVAAVLSDNPDLWIVDAQGDMETECVARLALGVAVCSDKDVWNAKKGEMIAVGRARKYCDDMLVINSRAMLDMLNDDAINNLLEREAGYVKEHIGKYIPGYDEMARRYKARQERQAKLDALTEAEHNLLNDVEHSSDAVKEMVRQILN